MSTAKITAQVRAAVRAVLADSADYDADTLRISRAGEVSARKSADKTYNATDAVRYLVGHVDDMVSATGARRAGW